MNLSKNMIEPISSYYAYLLMTFGLIIALYTQLKGITTPLSKPMKGISSLKWNQFSWFSFFILTFLGTLIQLFSLIFTENIIRYRAGLIPAEDSQIYGLVCSNNLYTISIDTLLIIIFFLSLMIGIKTISSHSSDRGNFSFSPKEPYELAVFLIGSYFFYPGFAFIMAVFGSSLFLIILYGLIFGPILVYIIRKGNPH